MRSSTLKSQLTPGMSLEWGAIKFDSRQVHLLCIADSSTKEPKVRKKGESD